MLSASIRIFAEWVPEYARSVEIVADPLLESKNESSKFANLRTAVELLVPPAGAVGWTVPPVAGLGIVVVPPRAPPARRPGSVAVEREPVT
jgi:hypothetical protein